MPPITIPTIDSLPEPPTKADPVNFAARADTFLGALPDFADTTNAAITEMNKIGAGLDQQTPIAAYDPGTTYDFPDVVAGSDGYSYRCVGTAVLGDDPVGSTTGNWVNLNGGQPGPLPTGVRLTGGIIGLGFTKTVEASVTVHPGVCFDSTGTIKLALAAEQVSDAGGELRKHQCNNGFLLFNGSGSSVFPYDVNSSDRDIDGFLDDYLQGLWDFMDVGILTALAPFEVQIKRDGFIAETHTISSYTTTAYSKNIRLWPGSEVSITKEGFGFISTEMYPRVIKFSL
jgi:hypothetical protein